jgi:hypothetical protein
MMERTNMVDRALGRSMVAARIARRSGRSTNLQSEISRKPIL